MSKNRYGLDFEVWGTTLPKNIKKEAAPLQTIAKGWNSSPKPYIAESDATYVAAAVNTEITSTLILQR
jgi:hypothetical protein